MSRINARQFHTFRQENTFLTWKNPVCHTCNCLQGRLNRKTTIFVQGVATKDIGESIVKLQHGTNGVRQECI